MLLQSGTYQPRVRPADPHGCSCHGLKTRRSQEAVKPAQKHLQLQGRQYGLKCRAAVEAVEETVEDDVPNDQKIRIKLKSYWVDRLTMSVEKIRDAARSTNAKFSGPVYLPTRTRRWCVLTSPHVNKDAREHFEIRTHSRLIDVKDLTADTIDRLMNLDLPSGVDVEIKL